MIVLEFKNVKVTPGKDVTTEMRITPGDADKVEVFHFLRPHVKLYWMEFHSKTPVSHKNFSLCTNRATFVFHRCSKKGQWEMIARVQIEFRPGKATILGSFEGNIEVR